MIENYDFKRNIKFKGKIINCIIRISYIENNEDICVLLFNNKDLTNTNFEYYSNIIKQSFAHVIIKFNNIKEKEYFRKLMTKFVAKFDLNDLILAFDKFNINIFDNYEEMLYFLELIIENFNDLKYLENLENYINRKLFETINYLTKLLEHDSKEEILKQFNFEKFLIYVFYLLLNMKGKVNPKTCTEVFETISIILKIIANNKNFLLKIFYIFFAELFDKTNYNEKNFLQNNNYDYFKNLKIIPLDLHKFEYLFNIIKYFSLLEPQIEIINLLNNYFDEVFCGFFGMFLSKNDCLIIDENDFLLCNFYHIFGSNRVYYEFYFYLIKYSKTINNNSGIIHLFPDLKTLLMNIYKLCPNPFYFEILIKFFQNLDDLQNNLIYIKEILDILLDLNLEYTDSNETKQKISLFNTIQLLQIFYYISKDRNLLVAFIELKLGNYVLKFFENLKKYKLIFLKQCIQMNINGKIYEKNIFEICFNITISIFFIVKNTLIMKNFFEFFLEKNNLFVNNENEFGKSIVFIFDIIDKSLNIINNEYQNNIKEYYSHDIEKSLIEKNYKKEEDILLIKFIMQLQMIKLNETENNNAIIIIHENSLINKFINLFINDLLILIKHSSGLKKSKNDNLYNYIIDSINKYNEDTIIKKEELIYVFEEACKKNQIKIDIFNDKIQSKNFIFYNYNSEKCPLKEKCLMLTNNYDEENNKYFETSKENISTYFDLNHKNIIKCFKKDLLFKDCSIYFNDIYFYNGDFAKIKNSFYYNYESNIPEQNLNDYRKYFLKYPSKLKNFSSNKYALPKIFLSCNTKLYQNKYFDLLYPKIKQNLIKDNFPFLPSHYLYFSELLKNSPQSPIFKEKLNCELIIVKHIIFGEIIFYNNFLIFKSEKNEDDFLKKYETNINYIFSSGVKEIQLLDKIIMIFYDDIEEIFTRSFAFIPQASEIFLNNGKSYLFNFYSEKNLKIFYNLILNIKDYEKKIKIIKDPKNKFKQLKFTKQWEDGEITNEQYLLYLNKYSGRTYNDFNQYPIFPWVTLNKNYFPEKKEINENEILFRDMNYFMLTQTENGRNEAKSFYNISERENPKNPIHFRFHYSTGGYILLYLMRIFPFIEEHIRLQSNNFDSPSRMVHNIDEILNIIKESKDTRELIPEFFTSIEYFLNLNYVYFGKRTSDNKIVNDMIVPHINLYREKLVNYIYFNKVFLNNNNKLTLNKNILLEECKINEWINLVFGYKQYPKEINKFNSFEKYSNRLEYSLMNSFNKLKKKNFNDDDIIKKMNAKKLRVIYFGQTPEQMFKHKHSKFHIEWDEHSSNKNYNLLDLINDDIKIITFWVSEDKDYIFFLIKNKKNKNIYVFIYDDNLKKKYEINIGKIKLFNIQNITKKNCEDDDNNVINNKKLKRENTFNSFIIYDKLKSKPIKYKNISELYSLNLRDAIFEIFDVYNIFFFVGRNKDNTIKIFSKENKVKGIIKLNSYVSVLHKKDRNNFFSGHMNGTLIEWNIEYKKVTDYNSECMMMNNISLKREIKAHNNALITAINYNERHNIILTSDINGILYIRKYIDFELLTRIELRESNCFTTQILVNDFNLIYTINYVENKLKKFICLYTLNGILIEKSKEHSIIDTHALKSGKIIFNRLEELELFIFGFNKIKPKDEPLISEDIFKKIEFQYENQKEYIMNFCILDKNIYLLLKNGKFIKGDYDALNLVCYGIN